MRVCIDVEHEGERIEGKRKETIREERQVKYRRDREDIIFF